MWNGTYDLCKEEASYEVLENSDATCNGDTKQGLPPMNMTNIFGMKVCGKRGGHSFIDEVRVEPFTRKCPKNFEPCSPNTDATDTICVDSSSGPNYKEKCPILDIVFIESQNEEYYKDQGYEITAGAWPRSGRKVAFSKTTARSFVGKEPIIGTTINTKRPCQGVDSERLIVSEDILEKVELPSEKDSYVSACPSYNWQLIPNTVNDRFYAMGS